MNRGGWQGFPLQPPTPNGIALKFCDTLTMVPTPAQTLRSSGPSLGVSSPYCCFPEASTNERIQMSIKSYKLIFTVLVTMGKTRIVQIEYYTRLKVILCFFI
jgi:hypothetical protein